MEEQNHHITEKLVTVLEVEQDFEAEIARVALEEAGIESTVLGGDLIANMPPLEVIKIEVQVFEKDVAKALEVLEEQKKQVDSSDDDEEAEEN